MHGKNVGPSDKWYPWFADEVQKLGFEYYAPALPKSDNPYIEEWKQCLDELRSGEDTVLVGHSRGGVAVLRWLEDQPPSVKVKKVILVAANSGFTDKMAIKSETNYGFYTQQGYNFAKIKQHCNNFVILHSKDDQWVPYEAGLENAKGLSAQLLSFEDKGRFGKGVDTIPELINEVQNARRTEPQQ
jgi:predicted alpha/beta hydrolase family esterase